MAVTFGSASAPSQKTINFDALFALSLANSRKVLMDNISTSNALWTKIRMTNGAYRGEDGGTNIEEPLMYALGVPHWYDGLDTLSTDATDGITKAVWEWRQAAVPTTISRKEVRQNAHKIVDLLESKIKQTDLGMQEFIPKAIMKGNKPNGGTLEAPAVDPVLGATGIEPLAKIVQVTPTSDELIGNINQSTSSWWRNQTLDFGATTTYDALLKKVTTLINNCSKGPGGKPDILVTDQATYENLEFAIYNRTRHQPSVNQEFPFENIIFKGITVTWDEFMHDAENDAESPDTNSQGTLYALNTKFWQVVYDTETNFIPTEKKTPINQDAFVQHILWMGNMVCSNRRKQGVLYGITHALTLT